MSEHININELGAKIATALGPQWHLDTSNERDWGVHIRHEADVGYALFLSTSWGGKGKLHISGSAPRGKNGHNGLRYNEHMISINVSDQKAPEQMAKDITKRLLPTYQEQYQRAKVSVEASDAYEARREALHTAADTLVREYERTHPYNSRRVNMYLKSTSDKDMTIDVSGLSLDQLKSIIALMSTKIRSEG